MKAEELLRIGKLFDAHGWPVATDEDMQFPLLFERFCRMCSRLTQAQRDLVLELARSYVRIMPEAYAKELFATWRRLVASLQQTVRKVVVAPLLAPNSERAKSADALLYSAIAYRETLERISVRRELHIEKSASVFTQGKWAGARDAVFVLIDDYIGSGGTAEKALAALNPGSTNIAPSSIVFLALAAQRAAIARIKNSGCDVVAGQILERGISDHPTLGKTRNALPTMTGIENMLKISNEYRLGFGSAEALVTLMRTPNNTFPVFWTNRKVDGIVWDAPFRR